MVVYLVTTLLQIFHRKCQGKNFENQSIFDEDTDKNLWLTCLAHPEPSGERVTQNVVERVWKMTDWSGGRV